MIYNTIIITISSKKTMSQLLRKPHHRIPDDWLIIEGGRCVTLPYTDKTNQSCIWLQGEEILMIQEWQKERSWYLFRLIPWAGGAVRP